MFLMTTPFSWDVNCDTRIQSILKSVEKSSSSKRKKKFSTYGQGHIKI